MKKTIPSYSKRLIYGANFALAVSLLTPTPAQGEGFNSNGAPFTTIYAFGDSLTDPGNFFELHGEYPPSPNRNLGSFETIRLRFPTHPAHRQRQ